MESDLAKILKEKTNAKIIWFLRDSERRYSDILKHLHERDSGKVNYHLKKLVAEKLVSKKNLFYSLTKKGVKYALYVDSLQLKEKYPLPVVLVAIHQSGKILLAKRNREPCKDHWGLPGNEILQGESLIESAKNEIQTEFDFDIPSPKLYGSYPTVYYENKELIYHVMLFAVKVNVKKVPLTGKAIGKISEYKFFTRKQIEKLRLIPSNKVPIYDSFSNRKKLLTQHISK